MMAQLQYKYVNYTKDVLVATSRFQQRAVTAVYKSMFTKMYINST